MITLLDNNSNSYENIKKIVIEAGEAASKSLKLFFVARM